MTSPYSNLETGLSSVLFSHVEKETDKWPPSFYELPFKAESKVMAQLAFEQLWWEVILSWLKVYPFKADTVDKLLRDKSVFLFIW